MAGYVEGGRGMKETRAYARLYLELVDDPKFASIYDDDRHFATWCRLLMIAEGAWPASAHLPRTAREASVKALADVGLVDLLPGDRYRIHGLDREREHRAERASRAADARWAQKPEQSTSNADAMPRRAEQSKDEQSTAEQSGASDPADVYWTLTGRYPTKAALGWIDRITDEHGGDAVSRALATAHREDPDKSSLLGRASNLLAASAHRQSQAAAEAERARLRERRAAQPEPTHLSDDDAKARWAAVQAQMAAIGIARPKKEAAA